MIATHNNHSAGHQQHEADIYSSDKPDEAPEGYVNKTCIACGNWIRIIYHQRRAADEPPDAVEYCEKCPLNTNTLSIKASYISDYVSSNTRPMSVSSTDSMTSGRKDMSLTRRYSGINSNNPRSLYLRSTSYTIVVEGLAANNCYSIAISESRQFQPVTAVSMVLDTPSNKQKVNLYTNFTMANQAHCLSDERKIAPMITLAKLDTYAPRGPLPPSSKEIVINRACLLNAMDHVETAILEVTREGKQCKIRLFLAESIQNIEDHEDKILQVLHNILVLYGHEATIKSFIPTTLVNACYINSGHAYDYPTAPEVGYVYTWKPDGERYWLVKYGCVWFYVRRLLSGRILGWHKPTSMKIRDNVGPIVDIEYMINHNPILIDVLVMDNGEPTSNVRSITDTLQNFKKLSITDIDITVRQYFPTHKELLSTRKSLTYPVDGTIGIKDHSMTIIKLKSEKSIELKLLSNGNLVAQQGEVVATMALPLIYPEDSIVELRFTKSNISSEYAITEVIPRTDKQTANEYKVCKAIIDTMESMPDNLARRNAVLWCNSIRRRMNETAAGSTGRGRVILDIGAGDGQSVSDYSTSPEVTYILLEPNERKCKLLSDRLAENSRKNRLGRNNQVDKQRMFSSADQILLAANLTSTKAIKYAIVCATLEDILKVDGCMRSLTNCVRHCISCFSISYVAPQLEQLSIKGLNVIGCGYFYDGVKVGDYLVNDHGVTMRRTGDATGAVTWGSDKVYEEPAITSANFEIFNIKLASEVIPVMNGSDDTLLNTISQKIYIISNARNV